MNDTYRKEMDILNKTIRLQTVKILNHVTDIQDENGTWYTIPIPEEELLKELGNTIRIEYFITDFGSNIIKNIIISTDLK